MVTRGIRSAHRIALREMRAAAKRSSEGGHAIAACAVLMTPPMPAWSVDEILDVHFRMHKAEGILFRDALARAAERCDLRLVEVLEKRLEHEAKEALGKSAPALREKVARLGRRVGPPWGKDQKDAALAAWIALGKM